MSEPRHDPWLPTPGLLTTSRTVKEAMLHDWGSPKTRQWHITPPTHVLAALEQAFAGYAAVGGVAGREDGFRVGRIGRLDQTP